MSDYLKEALSSIYSENDDFVIIGLTGRTGSGCTTAAKILATHNFEHIKTSLFNGGTPKTNQQRKQKIILNRARKVWPAFIHIRTSSLITMELKREEKQDTQSVLSDIGVSHEDIKKIERIKIKPPTPKTSLEETVNFYTKDLPTAHEKIKEILGKDFIRIYQELGRRMRCSGSITSADLKSNGVTAIPRTIDKIIKTIREKSKECSTNQKTYIVIDAIRNQFEATYFQDRYSSFYLMAVSCNEPDRISRLSKLGYNQDEIVEINSSEHSDDPINFDKEDAYMRQDIASCLQRADIYINNPNSKNTASKYFDLADQLITFVTLMIHPGLISPSHIERCMQIAYTAKLNSGCISRQVGAAVTDEEFSLRAIGWNDVPEGQTPCNLRCRSDLLSGRDQISYSDYEMNDTKFRPHMITTTIPLQAIWKDTGRNLSYCFKNEYNILKGEKNQVHTRSLHAEENAFLQISKHGGMPISGGKLFTTASPCELCSKKSYQLGIREIYFIDPYPGIATTHTLKNGSRIPELILFTGAIGRAFHNLYTPKIPYKDEIATLSKTMRS